MEHQQTKIEFYRQRTFSEKMNVTFEFIRENWKPLLKYTFFLIMPICLIQSFALNSVFNTYIGAIGQFGGASAFENSIFSILFNYGLLMLCWMIGTALTSWLIYAMMQTYATRENRLVDVTLSDIKEVLIRNTWKLIGLLLIFSITYVFIVLAMGFLVYTTISISALVAFLAFIFFILFFLMTIPIYIFERNIALIDATRKAWKFLMTTFWNMLGLMVVLLIIITIIQTITMVPWYLTVVVSATLSLASDPTNQSVIYKFATYIMGLVMSFGIYISITIGLIGLAFQYFHAREKVEGVTIESNITNFDEL